MASNLLDQKTTNVSSIIHSPHHGPSHHHSGLSSYHHHHHHHHHPIYHHQTSQYNIGYYHQPDLSPIQTNGPCLNEQQRQHHYPISYESNLTIMQSNRDQFMIDSSSPPNHHNGDLNRLTTISYNLIPAHNNNSSKMCEYQKYSNLDYSSDEKGNHLPFIDLSIKTTTITPTTPTIEIDITRATVESTIINKSDEHDKQQQQSNGTTNDEYHQSIGTLNGHIVPVHTFSTSSSSPSSHSSSSSNSSSVSSSSSSIKLEQNVQSSINQQQQQQSSTYQNHSPMLSSSSSSSTNENNNNTNHNPHNNNNNLY